MLPRYLIVSAGALAVDYIVYLALVRLGPGVSLATAAALGYLVGAIAHYLASRRFVFPRGWLHGRPSAEFVLFFATGIGGAAVTSAVVWTVSRLFDAGIHWPKVAAVGVSFLLVYVVRKRLVFRTHGELQASKSSPVDARA